jgi:murein DD-endopeptidase MepM/ murein hydrolase activator NlpD
VWSRLRLYRILVSPLLIWLVLVLVGGTGVHRGEHRSRAEHGSGFAAGTTRAAASGPNRFYHSDRTRYASHWYAGRHRIMIPYGCTRAPYYRKSPRCRYRTGFHHGVDIAIPCGVRVYSPVTGVVVSRRAAGAPGPAYGRLALRLRAGGRDYVLGHLQRRHVRVGQRVRRGQLVGGVGRLGAPDGCHLHAEVRRAGGGPAAAVNPVPHLRFRA